LDRVVGLDGVRVDIAMMRTPDGQWARPAVEGRTGPPAGGTSATTGWAGLLQQQAHPERADRRPALGLSEETAEQCQRVRRDGVGTVIGEVMCRAVDDVASEVAAWPP
jgi:hypothetical protein